MTQQNEPVDLAARIRSIPDFPKEGILFRDITTLLGDAAGFRAAVDAMVERYQGRGISRVAGIEARVENCSTPSLMVVPPL